MVSSVGLRPALDYDIDVLPLSEAVRGGSVTERHILYALARRCYALPARILARPPSAELRPDQKDTDSLPEYDLLDQILDAVPMPEVPLHERHRLRAAR